MKKILSFLVMSVFALTANADEGMWTLMDLPKAVYDKMVEEGYELDYNKLYQDDDAIYHAVVNFGGYCSGVVVSQDGLVFTNHHCGFEAIRSHSTVEHDYMLNGFVSHSYAEELPNEDLFVSFLVAQKDITDIVEEYNFRELSSADQEEILNLIEEQETKRIKVIDPTMHAEMKPYYERNRYYVDIYRNFNDVRLVFTVPKSMGKFGGETDNWMWPRQTCDFSVFRIYADPETNGPAEYSEENVPYHPKKWAPVSLQGYKEGDFAMTMGYPGSTQRYLSSFGIREMRNADNEPRWQTREVKQEVMLRHMRADEAVRIKYDSKYAQSSNYWKNAIGMNKCIDSINIIGLKQQYEAKLMQFLDTAKNVPFNGKLNLARLDSLYQERFAAARALTLYAETFSRTNELATRATRYCLGRVPLLGPEDKPKKQYVLFEDNSEEYDEALDKEVYAVLLKNYAEKSEPAYLPSFYETINEKFGGDYQAYVNYVWDNSALMKNNTKFYCNAKHADEDPGVEMGLGIIAVLYNIYADYADGVSEIEEQERLLCAAKLFMEENMPHYSDANFTLRLSYGQVGGYNLAGNPSGYYTDPKSLVTKMLCGDEETAGSHYNFEYYAEPIMHELFSAKDFGQYSDPVTGTMNLCFLTNNDITGGNSGSPVFNGKNELIGLAFDGNWDSLSGDIFFDTELARCICVDIRYMLFLMDKWGHADRLIKEINAK